jgi:hypothetical protein
MPAPQSEPPHTILTRKAALLALLTLAVALGLVLLARVYWARSPLLTFLLADGLMILVAGFSTRWTLRRQPAWVRFLSAVLILIAGLALAGYLTAGRIGIEPWKAVRGRADWGDIGQLVVGILFILLCLFSWLPRASRLVSDGRLAANNGPSPTNESSSQSSARPAVPMSPDDLAGNSTSAQSRLGNDPPSKGKRRRLSRRRSRLHLSDAQENRCPYCLELIQPDDPRGVVECKICHTLHHADCWAITGACQVPHYTS